MNQEAMAYLTRCSEEAAKVMMNPTPEDIQRARESTDQVKRSTQVYLENLEEGQARAHQRHRHQRYR